MSIINYVSIAVALFCIGAGYTLVTDYRDMNTQLVAAKAEVAKRDGRLASYERMVARRDAAIDASKCKPQIREWVKNPDNIPVPFNPFNQLSGPQ